MNLGIFLENLKLGLNAQRYASSSITELFWKKKLKEEHRLEVKRIREKWEGRKHARRHGDFYYRKPGASCWYVIESKGVKSNSEEWCRLYNFGELKSFGITHTDKIPWIDRHQDIERQVTDWVYTHLPKFRDEYSSPLHEHEEAQEYKPKRETEKAKPIAAWRGYARDEINGMIEERLNYVMSRVKVLEAHFVSDASGASERAQVTPRKDEFNVLAIDIVLRYPVHKFVFTNPQNLESS